MWHGDTRWRHVVVSTHRSWLPGDTRGFRSRKHRVHSSGDYKNPPPEDEHAGLRKYLARHAAPRVEIPPALRAKVGAAFVRKLQDLGCRVVAAAQGERHGHYVVELPDDYNQERWIVGKAKQISSYLVRDKMPGRIWAAGGRFKLIKDRKQQLNVIRYAWKRQERGAWTWIMFEALPED